MKRYFFVESLFDSYNADDVDILIEEKDKEIAELQASNKQAWGICDAVAKELGEHLHHDEGSAWSVRALIEKLRASEARESLLLEELASCRGDYA